MTTDQNKHIDLIKYNHLNLPIEIQFDNGKIYYTYDAAGTKLKKQVQDGSTITRTDYVSGYQYKDNVLQFFPTAEGYVNKEATGYKYVYNYTDHLGNVRLSYADNDGNGSIDTSEILEENNYYAFGLKHKGYNGVSIANDAYKYKYNGKELQDELGLDWYDYGARNYDASLGRWMNVDPHAEKYYDYTPYNYAFNSPTSIVDYDGKDGIVTGSGTEKDPYVVKANYYYYGLNDKQVEGLKSSIASYNNDGKARKIKTKNDGNIFVIFDLNSEKVENKQEAYDKISDDVIENEDGIATALYGNAVTVGNASTSEGLGSAGRRNIVLDQDKIKDVLANDPNAKESYLIAGTFIHEIGHTLGGSHGDPGKIMIPTTQIDSDYTEHPKVSKDGIRAIIGRAGADFKRGSLQSKYISDKELKKIKKAHDPGSDGKLFKIKK